MRSNVVNINETKVISVFSFFFKVTACLREFAPTSYVITKDPRRDGAKGGGLAVTRSRWEKAPNVNEIC